MDGENNGKPYEQMDDLGENPPIFGNTHMSDTDTPWTCMNKVVLPGAPLLQPPSRWLSRICVIGPNTAWASAPAGAGVGKSQNLCILI